MPGPRSGPGRVMETFGGSEVHKGSKCSNLLGLRSVPRAMVGVFLVSGGPWEVAVHKLGLN